MPKELLLYGAALPGALSAIVFLATRRAALAVGLGFLAARTAFSDWTWPGLKSTMPSADWIPWLVAAAVLCSLVPRRVPGRWLLGVALCSAAPWLYLLKTHGDEYALLGVLAGAALLWWLLVAAAARRRPGVTLPLVLAVACGGAAPVLAEAGSITLAQLAGALAAACCVLVLFAQGRKIDAAALPVALAGTGLLLGAHFYLDRLSPAASLLLAAAAPLGAWAGEAPALRKPWQRLAAAAVATALPVAIAAAIVFTNAPPPNPYSGY